MKLVERLKFTGPLLRIPQACEMCGESFACEIGLRGCWCLQVKVSDKTKEALRAQYSRCLCRACLVKADVEQPECLPQV